MAKRKTPIDKAIEAIEAEVNVLMLTLKRLVAVRDAAGVETERRKRQRSAAVPKPRRTRTPVATETKQEGL